ncbi:MAG: hypothetical protein NT050_13415 [Verrucomicrobia bacterium]|jgi:hypothetical protein|nr:hypothetical protein [Verrucomicrobiota bacterium]
MKKPLKYSSAPKPPDVLRDLPALSRGLNESVGMVRTQIYLTRTEHGFIEAEAARRGETMAAVIRGCIDDKMRVPDTAWAANPMLEPTPSDAGLELPEDAAINHDHYLYGTAKKYLKKRGKWVLAESEARH